MFIPEWRDISEDFLGDVEPILKQVQYDRVKVNFGTIYEQF